MVRTLIVLAVLFLTGCSGTLPAQYQPQTYDQIENSQARIGEFTYEPANQNGIDTNQLQNTAIGKIKIGTKVADFVQRATALELLRAGVNLDEKNGKEVRGTIHELMLDDLGYSVDWRYKITYTVLNNQEKEEFSETYVASARNTGKFGSPSDYTSTLNEVVLEPIEMFFDDIEEDNLLRIEQNQDRGEQVS